MKPRPPLPDGPFLVVGLARSGTAAALELRARGEEVLGVDAGAPAGLQALADAGVRLRLQADGLRELESVRTVVKSPGVPAQAPAIAAARARGVPVLGELELAWRMLKNEFIAVTGTNGKTTTVELIGHIHREAGLPVEVAGNVGTALSGLVGRIEERATIVCEASSFQLEDTIAFAPEAAVLLNFSPDHLDRHGTLEDYLAAKLRVFAHQDESDLAVLPRRLAVDELGGRARRLYFDELEGLPVDELRLPGAHNLQNAMAAAAVCLARGMDPDAVRAGLRTFPGVPHRLEEVARRAGVIYVNDSKATNIVSTLVALRAFAGCRVHLILGGQGKNQDFAPLRGPVELGCRAVYLIGEDAPLIADALEDVAVPVRRCGDLERALAVARDYAAPGDVILLSPGCASFDQFADFEARGERFRELVLSRSG
ncbi:MAG: UDP-N-acetylmuramoyl-L-alanine--D-glutamate ligase [Solirubrobacterales bacterium]